MTNRGFRLPFSTKRKILNDTEVFDARFLLRKDKAKLPNGMQVFDAGFLNNGSKKSMRLNGTEVFDAQFCVAQGQHEDSQ